MAPAVHQIATRVGGPLGPTWSGSHRWARGLGDPDVAGVAHDVAGVAHAVTPRTGSSRTGRRNAGTVAARLGNLFVFWCSSQPLYQRICTLRRAWANVLSRTTEAETAPSAHADVAQLVAHHLAKVRVAGSNPVIRSRGRAKRDSFAVPLAGGVAEW